MRQHRNRASAPADAREYDPPRAAPRSGSPLVTEKREVCYASPRCQVPPRSRRLPGRHWLIIAASRLFFASMAPSQLHHHRPRNPQPAESNRCPRRWPHLPRARAAVSRSNCSGGSLPAAGKARTLRIVPPRPAAHHATCSPHRQAPSDTRPPASEPARPPGDGGSLLLGQRHGVRSGRRTGAPRCDAPPPGEPERRTLERDANSPSPPGPRGRRRGRPRSGSTRIGNQIREHQMRSGGRFSRVGARRCRPRSERQVAQVQLPANQLRR